MPRGERLPWRRDACRPLPGAWLNAGMAGPAAWPAPAAPRCGRVAAGKRRTSQQNACRASRRRRAIAAGRRQTGTRPARSPRGSGRTRQPPRLQTHAVWNPRAAPVALRRRHSGATGPLGPPWRAEAPTRPPRPAVLRGRIPRAERRRATRRVARGWRAWAPVVEGPPRPGASPPVSLPSLHRAPVMPVQRHHPAVGRHHGRASPSTRPPIRPFGSCAVTCSPEMGASSGLGAWGVSPNPSGRSLSESTPSGELGLQYPRMAPRAEAGGAALRPRGTPGLTRVRCKRV